MPASLSELRMGVAHKHAYRFGFLKSEFWSNFRIAAFVHYGEACDICASENEIDLHHIWYPKNPYDVKIWHVRPICRPCHERLHELTNPGSYEKHRDATKAFYIASRKMLKGMAMPDLSAAKKKERRKLKLTPHGHNVRRQ